MVYHTIIYVGKKRKIQWRDEGNEIGMAAARGRSWKSYENRGRRRRSQFSNGEREGKNGGEREGQCETISKDYD